MERTRLPPQEGAKYLVLAEAAAASLADRNTGERRGMYREAPSNKGGMNWLPSLNARGNVRARKTRFKSTVVFWKSKAEPQHRQIERLRDRDTRICLDSGRRRPRMNRSISGGTSVMASMTKNL